MALDFLLLWLLEFCAPRERVDIARDWPKKKRTFNEEEGMGGGGGGQGRMKGKVGNGGGGSVGGAKGGGRKGEVAFTESKTNGIGK